MIHMQKIRSINDDYIHVLTFHRNQMFSIKYNTCINFIQESCANGFDLHSAVYDFYYE